MKAVLISIQPNPCELITSGKKMDEVRKTKPKLAVPFKAYIYESSGNTIVGNQNFTVHLKGKGRKKVIGEFICDDIVKFKFDILDKTFKDVLNKSCVYFEHLAKYLGKNEIGYAWHISNLIIYDKPKELSEFKTVCKSYHDGDKCDDCKYFIDGRGYEYDESDCACDGLKPIERPPQSWCYVEELR